MRQPHRKPNTLMQDMVKSEVLKLLDVGILYLISNNRWVSSTQVVPKKGKMTMVKNDQGELISTILTTEWRVCIDFKKLNSITKKDHFQLPFLNQVLEMVVRHDYYYFSDGYSSYFQIVTALEDREKNTFLCLFNIFAYRHMPFGLYNASTIF